MGTLLYEGKEKQIYSFLEERKEYVPEEEIRSIFELKSIKKGNDYNI